MQRDMSQIVKKIPDISDRLKSGDANAKIEAAQIVNGLNNIRVANHSQATGVPKFAQFYNFLKSKTDKFSDGQIQALKRLAITEIADSIRNTDDLLDDAKIEAARRLNAIS